MLPIQRSTPAEGSVGGVGGASTTTSRRLATATTSKGRCSGRSATTAPAASIRRSSLKAGIVAPSVMLRKLAGLPPPSPICGTERTLFMLDWLESPELRRRCHAGLNKSAQRHFLAQVICTFKQGRQTRPANKAGKQGRQTRPANKAGKQGRQTRPANKAGKQGRQTRPANKAGKQGRQ